jgi:hypothetical protein
MPLMVYLHAWANNYYVECDTPLARNVGHIISMLSVKWAYYCYGVHIRGPFECEFGNGMLRSMHIKYTIAISYY